MSDDREKLLQIMSSLEKDYRSGKISAEKYSYFRSKYEDKLNTIDAQAATKRIRSMQGKPADNKRKKEVEGLPTIKRNKNKIWFKSILLILKKVMLNIIKKKNHLWMEVHLSYSCYWYW